MIISFAHTTPALLAGRKTVTRRDWKPRHAELVRWNGPVHEAYDRSPRVGGRKVATIEVVSVDLESIRCLFEAPAYGRREWEREGGDLLWPTVDDFLDLWRDRYLRFPSWPIYRVEFKLLEVLGCP